MLNKYEKLTEPHKIISNIFDNINAGMEAGKKPADKAIEEYERKFDKTRVVKKTSNKLLKAMLRDLKKEKVILKKSLSKAGEFIEELKQSEVIANVIIKSTNGVIKKLKAENKELKAKLRRFDEIFNNFESKRKGIK